LVHHEPRPQHVVPANDLVQRRDQRRVLERTPKPEPEAEVIRGISRLDLIEKPEPLLPGREGIVLPSVRAGDAEARGLLLRLQLAQILQDLAVFLRQRAGPVRLHRAHCTFARLRLASSSKALRSASDIFFTRSM